MKAKTGGKPIFYIILVGFLLSASLALLGKGNLKLDFPTVMIGTSSSAGVVLASQTKDWQDMVRHALKGHEEAIVRCLEWNQFHSSWTEAWLSQETQRYEGKIMPSAAVARDLSSILKSAADAGPCAQVTAELVNRELGTKTNFSQVRAVVVFARDIRNNGDVTHHPLSMYLVPDWERWRCYHGYTTMLYPSSGYRPC